MERLLVSLLIFALRITDVSIGTIRVIYTIRGQRLRACLLGFFESAVFIFAISRVLKDLDDPVKMLAYAAGFATGTFVGITIENWIASGWILARIISRESAAAIADALRRDNFGVTLVHGQGISGDMSVLFVVARRRRGRELLDAVQGIDPNAFITIDPVAQAIGGHIPHFPSPAGVRK